MRFKSKTINGYTIYAVSGVHSVSFAIDFDQKKVEGLLGFAVERFDHKENERYFMKGFKVFKSVTSDPIANEMVSTFEHPIQSFVWDDFTTKPEYTYDYWFYPLKGKPKNIDRSAKPIHIQIQTEALFHETEEHQVFFNRGVASSQAYLRKFKKSPKFIKDKELKEQALDWLSRELDEAAITFIQQAKRGDKLFGCFYEFRFEKFVKEIKLAIDRGVEVKVIIDAKENSSTDKKGKFHESFPREENLRVINEVGIDEKEHIIKRIAKKSNIQHNKFMVFVPKISGKPEEVWTGSTNISMGGFYGQTNVGHWVRNSKVAQEFMDYWNILKDDPGGMKGDELSTVRKKNDAFKKSVMEISPSLKPTDIPNIPIGTTTLFSPRIGDSVLKTYAKMLDSANDLACITLAFGINAQFKEQLVDNDASNHLIFFLLEKEDKPNKRSKKEFIRINSSNNVYKAWGSKIEDDLYKWTKETLSDYNKHVRYIHSKFMLIDPLGNNPIVVTGSANFSSNSTTANDENMLLIKGNKRVADIYFTEFNRLFFHYYFRSVIEKIKYKIQNNEQHANVFLVEDDTWLSKYKPNTIRAKRIDVFKKMDEFE